MPSVVPDRSRAHPRWHGLLDLRRVQGVLDRVGAGSFAQAFELRRRAVHDGVGCAHPCCGDSRSGLTVLHSDFSSSAMRRSAEWNAFSDSSMEPTTSASVPLSCGPSTLGLPRRQRSPGFTSVAEAFKPGRESRRPGRVGRWCRWQVAQFVRFGVLRAVVGPAISVDNHLLPLPGR